MGKSKILPMCPPIVPSHPVKPVRRWPSRPGHARRDGLIVGASHFSGRLCSLRVGVHGGTCTGRDWKACQYVGTSSFHFALRGAHTRLAKAPPLGTRYFI